MSAYIVDKRHIDYLVEVAATNLPTIYLPGWQNDPARIIHADTPEGRDQLGRLLWAENYQSFNWRYDENEVVPEYHFESGPGIEPHQIFASLDCYEYQSCEHLEWAESDAWRICQMLRKAATRDLPGMEGTVWGAPWEACYAEQ